MWKALVFLLALAPMASATGTFDISGDYTSNWGAVTLHQHGTHVTGTYVYEGGRLDGTLVGNKLTYTWHEKDSSGHGIFVVATDGDLIGTWGLGSDDIAGGGWHLVPARALAQAAPN